MNLLIGVVCEVVETVARKSKDEILIQSLVQKLSGCFAAVDTNSDMCVSKHEFHLMVENPEVRQVLHEVGVDIYALVDFTHEVFGSRQELDFFEFLRTVLQFRGNNTATIRDMVQLRRYLANKLHRIEDLELRLLEFCDNA